MKSLSPWHTNAAVCAQAFIKLAEIRQLAKAFGVNLLGERIQDENTANTFCLRSHCNHHHFPKTLLEIALVLVRLDRVANFFVKPDHSIVRPAAEFDEVDARVGPGEQPRYSKFASIRGRLVRNRAAHGALGSNG